VVSKSVTANMPVNLNAVGHVEPSATVGIVARTAGELKEVLVRDGQQVTAGQLLFVIDQKPAEIALHQVQALLESDRARLAKAEADLARSRKLTRGGFTSAAQNDEARVEALGYRAAVKADEAAVEQAQLNLSYCEIRAPMSGRAGDVKVDPGNYIPAHTRTLLTIDAMQPVTVTFAVPERHLWAIRDALTGAELPVMAQPRQGREAAGFLDFVGNVDTATGTVPLKAVFANEDNQLWPGEFVRITLRLAVRENVVIVPGRAVVIGPNGPFVYVVGDDMKARIRLVTTGVEHEDNIEIISGLTEGEQVVTEGHVRLGDGMTVRFPEAGDGAGQKDAGANP